MDRASLSTISACACVVFYGHVSFIASEVMEGASVTPGMVVGKSGIGNNFAHLHLEIRPSREELTFYNPLYFFTTEALSVVENKFTDYMNGSDPWRIYGYSSRYPNGTYGYYWDNTLPALWVR